MKTDVLLHSVALTGHYKSVSSSKCYERLKKQFERINPVVYRLDIRLLYTCSLIYKIQSNTTAYRGVDYSDMFRLTKSSSGWV
jgi:hypothetical protein